MKLIIGNKYIYQDGFIKKEVELIEDNSDKDWISLKLKREDGLIIVAQRIHNSLFINWVINEKV